MTLISSNSLSSCTSGKGLSQASFSRTILLATCRLNTGEPVLIFSLDLRSKWQLSVN